VLWCSLENGNHFPKRAEPAELGWAKRLTPDPAAQSQRLPSMLIVKNPPRPAAFGTLGRKGTDQDGHPKREAVNKTQERKKLMLNRIIYIDRGDGLGSTGYDALEVKELTTGQSRRWGLFGRRIGDRHTNTLIAAYDNMDVADLVETTLHEAGQWFQHGRTFARFPRFVGC
jgi:hypothetical protein